MGYLIYRVSGGGGRGPEKRLAGLPVFLLFTIFLSLLPDIDSIIGILLGDMKGYHNNFTHSLAIGLVVAFLMAGLGWLFYRARFLFWFVVSFLSYTMHILMDTATLGGRGVMLLWPFTTQRYSSPITFFYGVQWSDGLFSVHHLITLVSEALFVMIVIFLSWLLENRRSRSQWQNRSTPIP